MVGDESDPIFRHLFRRGTNSQNTPFCAFACSSPATDVPRVLGDMRERRSRGAYPFATLRLRGAWFARFRWMRSWLTAVHPRRPLRRRCLLRIQGSRSGISPLETCVRPAAMTAPKPPLWASCTPVGPSPSWAACHDLETGGSRLARRSTVVAAGPPARPAKAHKSAHWRSPPLEPTDKTGLRGTRRHGCYHGHIGLLTSMNAGEQG